MKIRGLFISGLLLTSAVAANAQAWQIDTFSTGAGNLNNVYYGLKDGVAKEANAKTWHLGFSTGRMDAGVLANSADMGMKVFVLDVDTADFGTDLSAALPIAIAANPTPLYNSNVIWETGAFNQNTSGGFDYGWGNYNMTSHLVEGKSVYAVITSSDTLQVFFSNKDGRSSTTNGPIYTFKYAKLNGSNAVVNKTISLGTIEFAGQNFAYYNFDSDSLFSREAKSADWDLLFTRYNASAVPIGNERYGVFGILTNKNVKVAAYHVDTFIAHDTLKYDQLALTYDTAINSIGFNKWKFAGQSGYGAYDTTSFFVKQANNNIYQVVFTDFVSGAAATEAGRVVLQKRLVYEVPVDTGTSVEKINSPINALVIAPNPVYNGQTNIVIDANAAINNVVLTVADINGRVVYSSQINVNKGFYQYPLNVANLSKGMYVVTLRGAGIAQSQKLNIQ